MANKKLHLLKMCFVSTGDWCFLNCEELENFVMKLGRDDDWNDSTDILKAKLQVLDV
jgi:hypothetical protein